MSSTLPYRPEGNRVRSRNVLIRHNNKKYHVIVGYKQETDTYTPRVVRIFPSFKIGTDMEKVCQIFSNYITLKLQVYADFKEALHRLINEEPKMSDGTPCTIVGAIAKLILEEPTLWVLMTFGFY